MGSAGFYPLVVVNKEPHNKSDTGSGSDRDEVDRLLRRLPCPRRETARSRGIAHGHTRGHGLLRVALSPSTRSPRRRPKLPARRVLARHRAQLSPRCHLRSPSPVRLPVRAHPRDLHAPHRRLRDGAMQLTVEHTQPLRRCTPAVDCRRARRAGRRHAGRGGGGASSHQPWLLTSGVGLWRLETRRLAVRPRLRTAPTTCSRVHPACLHPARWRWARTDRAGAVQHVVAHIERSDRRRAVCWRWNCRRRRGGPWWCRRRTMRGRHCAVCSRRGAVCGRHHAIRGRQTVAGAGGSIRSIGSQRVGC